MNTLIELYDERAIENILAPDMFHPRRIIYLCPREVLRDHKYFFMRLLSHNSMSCVLDLTGDFFSGCVFAAALS